MAKFEDYLDNSTLTWSDLNEQTNNKIDRFGKLYGAYEQAVEANDEKTATKYEAQLNDLDGEILASIKKQDTPKEAKPKVEEEKPVQAEVVPQPKEEPKAEAKEEPKAETEEDDGWDFGLLKW
jgi:hypothetical protein